MIITLAGRLLLSRTAAAGILPSPLAGVGSARICCVRGLARGWGEPAQAQGWPRRAEAPSRARWSDLRGFTFALTGGGYETAEFFARYCDKIRIDFEIKDIRWDSIQAELIFSTQVPLRRGRLRRGRRGGRVSAAAGRRAPSGQPLGAHGPARCDKLSPPPPSSSSSSYHYYSFLNIVIR